MKFRFAFIILLFSGLSWAEPICDVRVGDSVGIRVVEFASGNKIFSKMPLTQSTPEAIYEEMVNLQDESLCAEKIISRKCVLKFEKVANKNLLTLFRGQERWNSWQLAMKTEAETFVRKLKKHGFCL